MIHFLLTFGKNKTKTRMSNDGQETKEAALSTSPKEDFDPLVDEGSFLVVDSHDLDPGDDPEDTDSQCNSLGNSTGAYQEPASTDQYRYGMTPPTNYRAVKRAKEKSRSHKFSSKNEMREITAQIRTTRTPNRQRSNSAMRPDSIYLGDSGTAVVDGKESAAEVEGSTVGMKKSSSSSSLTGRKKRPSGSKSHYKVARGQERDYKLHEVMNLGISAPKNATLKVDSPSQFKSLDSKQVFLNSSISPQESSYLGSLQSMYMLSSRGQLGGGNPCTKERLEFIRTFNMLIRMGNRAAMKHKESKALMNRQLSYEQEEWQAKHMDIIWLELRAFINRRKVSEQDDLHYKMHQKVDQVLEAITNFKVRLKETRQSYLRSQSSQLAFDANNMKDSVIKEETVGEDCDRQGIFSSNMEIEGVSCNNGDISKASLRHRSSSLLLFDPMLSDIIQEQKAALAQIIEVLDMLEMAESLYPTYKALGQSHNMYNEASFQCRLRTLYLWMNITVEMGHKLHHMAKLLQIDNLSLDWPWREFNPKQFLQHCRKRGSNSDGTPQIYVSQPSREFFEDDEDDENCEDCCDSTDEDESDSEYDSDEDSDDSDEESESEDETTGSSRLDVPKKNVHFDMSDSNSSCAYSPDCTENPLVMPSDTSTPAKTCPPSRSTSLLSHNSHSSTSMSFEESARTAIYRDHADRMLKRMGVKKLLVRLKDLLEGTLQRARGALEKPKDVPTYATITSIEAPSEPVLSSSPSMDGLSRPPPLVIQDSSGDLQTSLSAHGAWSPAFTEMRLPSFKPTYLFLVRIPLDVIHECLRLRLEQQPRRDPSSYSIRHLIKECKEVLQAATTMKIYYQQMVQAVLTDDDSCDLDLDQFEDDLERMLEVYLDYLRLYMSVLQQNNRSAMSKQLKNFLEEEWKYAKEIIPHIRGGEGNAANRFCIMATSLLQSISNFLESGMDECINQLYDLSTTSGLDEFTTGSGSDTEPLDTPGGGAGGGASSPGVESETEAEEPDMEVQRMLSKRNSRSVEVRKGIFQTCRSFKELFNEARERLAKALNFAKMLRKDLEIAAEYNIIQSPRNLLRKLKDTKHIRVQAAHTSGYLMFIPQHIMADQQQVLHLLIITCGREDLLNQDRTPDKHANGKDAVVSPPKPEGYLVIVPGQDDQYVWDGEVLNIESTAEITIALSHTEVESLLLVVLHSSQLAFQRKDFESRVGMVVQLARDQISCYTVIADSIQDLMREAVFLRDRVDEAIQNVEKHLSLDDVSDLDDQEKLAIQTRYRETLLRCYNFGCEYHEELLRLVSFDMRNSLYPHLIDLARRWMTFAITKCEKGRGRRPKWAHTGLNFLTLAINPISLSSMTEAEFQEIKTKINTCIHHVIGDKNTQPAGFRVSSPDVTSQQPRFINRIHSYPESSFSSGRTLSATRSFQSEPATPHPTTAAELYNVRKSTSLIEGGFEEQETVFSLSPETASPKDPFEPYTTLLHEEGDFPRLKEMHHANHKMERRRNRMLRTRKMIGHRTRKDKEVDLVHVRPVKFRWQRTTKIGEGRFGKVYTAVNTNTGELMAMKEMKFQSNDVQYIKKIIDEIKNLENISGHPSLVQYFGVEVHTDEIYIFMEYCPGGTLAEAAKQGLSEDMIRKYTKEILVAVNVLHEHNIVHRDIKGPNIFLTEKGPLKLGDLGCAVQLKGHSTMPGELKEMEGTAAYMAPEVFTNHEGGRSSDIWSLGCTVIEMATGKRPWPELESQFQIMYKVGMGVCPAIPQHLSEEGQDFIKNCLVHEPKQRWTASRLQEHSFVKIYPSDDENEGNA